MTDCNNEFTANYALSEYLLRNGPFDPETVSVLTAAKNAAVRDGIGRPITEAEVRMWLDRVVQR